MGDNYKKIVEEGTDAKYLPMGTKCDLCGKKLGFFFTGFWSCNTKHLSDGALCAKCAKQINTLADEMAEWMPQELLAKWKRYADYNWQNMSLEQARVLLALKEQKDMDSLEAYGDHAQALLSVHKSFVIEPTISSVGIVRAKRMKNKMVVYGRVEQGVFRQSDVIRIDHGGVLTEATILEAYMYDPDVPENDFEGLISAHMGKQQLAEDQVGWLILDFEGQVFPDDRIVR